MPPKVTIIMPCFNGERHLARSIGSVLAQNLQAWELVVINDGSTDASAGTIDAFSRQNPRIVAIHQANQGVVAARNRGLAARTAEYVAFLDCDDSWDPDFLRAMTEALDSRTDAGIAYCGWQNSGLGPSRDHPYVPPDYEAGHKIESMVRDCPWPVHAAVMRSSLLREIGGFDAEMTSCEDFDLWLRSATRVPVVRVARVLTTYNHHGGGQMTQNRAKMAFNHLRAQQRFLGTNPDVAKQLGARKVAELTLGQLLKRGYIAHWQRDLSAARRIFRHVMVRGYGRPKDWFYMLPSLMPESLHRWIMQRRDAGAPRS